MSADLVNEAPYSPEEYKKVNHTPLHEGVVGQLDVSAARDHLDRVPEQYLEAINSAEPEELEEYIDKVKPLTAAVSNPSTVLSVGVGRGLEVHALADAFRPTGAKIFGLDLSELAINKAQEYLMSQGIDAELILGSAIDMPFVEGDVKIDAMVLSAILHEIYSYVPNGRRAWKKAIQDSVHSLSKDGALLLRDFAAPHMPSQLIELSLKTTHARNFYDYFRDRYRTFETWDVETMKRMVDRRLNNDDYPGSTANGLVALPFGAAAELMLHFRNYQDHIRRGMIQENDPRWKEIDECYLIPDAESKNNTPITPDQYINRVLTTANDSLGGDQLLMCFMSQVVERPKTASYLKSHFGINMEGISDADSLYSQVPRKLECIFKRTI